MSFDPVQFCFDYFMSLESKNDLERSMGNTELRLTLGNIEDEISHVKSIAIDTNVQAKKTNGRVNWMEKVIWTAMGALPLLTVWSGWLTLKELEQPSQITTDQLTSAVQSAVTNAFDKNLNIK